MLVEILGFLLFSIMLFSFALLGVGCYCFLFWMENERMPFFRSKKFSPSFVYRMYVYSLIVAFLFVGIRYKLIPWIGVSPVWALGSLPIQFMIGWVVMWRLQGQPMEGDMMSRGEDHPNVMGG